MRLKEEHMISVIVPVYNGEKYLDDCISSIVHQTYANLQIIIVDDGSKDNSYDIVKKWEEKDNRIISHKQENSGVSNARNKGMLMATGSFIAFVDQDDLLDLDYFAYLLSLAIENHAEISMVPNVVFYNAGKKEYREKISPETIKIWSGEDAVVEMLYTNIEIGPWNKIVSHELIKKNGIQFHNELFGGEGFAYSIDCFKNASRIAVGYRGVYNYRIDNASSGMSRFRPNIMESSIKTQKIIRDGLKKTHRLVKACDYSKWKVYMVMLSIMFACDATGEYPQLYKELVENTKRGFFKVLFAPLPLKRKLIELRFCVIPQIIGMRCAKNAQRNYERNLKEGE